MDVLNFFLCFMVVSLSVLSPFINADDICVKKTACRCEFSNGTGIDLKNSALPYFFKTHEYYAGEMDYTLYTFYFHPCFDVKPVIPASENGRFCDLLSGVYRTTTTMTLENATTNSYRLTQEICEYMGDSTRTIFSDDGRAITYLNGPSKITILLVCAQCDDKLQVESMEDPSHIFLNFFSRNACPIHLASPTRTASSTLLNILKFFFFQSF
ncbi:hypothetical protein NE865_04613 [Phthorimaea operculella]|nr:hypothetical protein NE865_04613 [Phthorimaea operculella]